MFAGVFSSFSKVWGKQKPEIVESKTYGIWIWVVVSNIFIFTPNLGEDFPFLTNSYFSIGLKLNRLLSSYGIDSSLPRFYVFSRLKFPGCFHQPTCAEVKGCFILRPWAYKLWEQIQASERDQKNGSKIGVIFFGGKIGMFGWDGSGWFIHFICFCLKLLLPFSGKF